MAVTYRIFTIYRNDWGISIESGGMEGELISESDLRLLIGSFFKSAHPIFTSKSSDSFVIGELYYLYFHEGIDYLSINVEKLIAAEGSRRVTLEECMEKLDNFINRLYGLVG